MVYVMRYVDWLLATSCCLYRVDPPDDEQQACSKHVEAYYWNKLTAYSASCWFILYGQVSFESSDAATVHSDQNTRPFFHLLQSSTQEHKCYAQVVCRNTTLMIEGRRECHTDWHLLKCKGGGTEISEIVTAKTSSWRRMLRTAPKWEQRIKLSYIQMKTEVLT